jgi:hypothetical protein
VLRRSEVEIRYFPMLPTEINLTHINSMLASG